MVCRLPGKSTRVEQEDGVALRISNNTIPKKSGFGIYWPSEKKVHYNKEFTTRGSK